MRLENVDVSVHSGEPDVGTTLGGGLEASERFFEFGDVPAARELVPTVLLPDAPPMVTVPAFECCREFVLPNEDGTVLSLFWIFDQKASRSFWRSWGHGTLANFVLESGNLVGIDTSGSVFKDVEATVFGDSFRHEGGLFPWKLKLKDPSYWRGSCSMARPSSVRHSWTSSTWCPFMRPETTCLVSSWRRAIQPIRRECSCLRYSSESRLQPAERLPQARTCLEI